MPIVAIAIESEDYLTLQCRGYNTPEEAVADMADMIDAAHIGVNCVLVKPLDEHNERFAKACERALEEYFGCGWLE